MPFTLAHPTVVLPLLKQKRLSVTGLIIGSMIPDFEFFLQMREVENIGHHWYGIILFDVPMAFLFCYIFHNLLRNLFIANLPGFLRNRCGAVYNFNWNSYAANNKVAVLLSIVIGVVSHVGWDAFTHYDGVFVDAIPFLAQPIEIQSHSLPVYFLLQLFFSAAGLMVMLLYVFQLPILSKTEIRQPQKIYWPLLIVLFLILFSIRVVAWAQYNTFWGLVMAAFGGFTYSWIATSFFFKYLKNKLWN